MELSANFAQVAQDTVLRPDWTGAVVIFWFAFFNELIALFPYVIVVSGQLLFMEAGSHAVISKLFLFIALPAGIGGGIGSFLIYGVAYLGGKPAIERSKTRLWFSWEDIERVNRRFKGVWYDEFIFLALRIMPLLPSFPTSAAAGIIRMSPARYFALSALGFTIRMMIMLLFVGWGMETLAE